MAWPPRPVYTANTSVTPLPQQPQHVQCSESPSKWHCVDIHPAPRGPEVNRLVEAPCWGVSYYHYLEKGSPDGGGLRSPSGGFGQAPGRWLLPRSHPQFISYSHPRNAPLPLASSLAHEAVSQLLQMDLSQFRKLPRQEEEDDEEEEKEKAPVTREFSLSGPQT